MKPLKSLKNDSSGLIMNCILNMWEEVIIIQSPGKLVTYQPIFPGLTMSAEPNKSLSLGTSSAVLLLSPPSGGHTFALH